MRRLGLVKESDGAKRGGLTAPRAPARRVPPEWASSRPRAQRARRVADVLRQRISSGSFADGVLPDELALAGQLDASRNAVREALTLLRDEGLLTRRRGVGTVVVTPEYGHGLDRLAGLAEALAGYGTVTNEVLLTEADADPPAEIARRLGLDAGATTVRIERIRRINGEPVSLDSTYLTTGIGRDVLRGDLENRDIFTLIEETAGCPLGRAEIEVRAAIADRGTAALLGIRAGAAVFVISRLTRLSDGTPVDAELLRIRADRMTLRATLHRGLG